MRGLGPSGQFVAEKKLAFRIIARMYHFYRTEFCGVPPVTGNPCIPDLLCDVEIHVKRTCGSWANDILILLLSDWEKVPEIDQVALGIAWDNAGLREAYREIFLRRKVREDIRSIREARVKWDSKEIAEELLTAASMEETDVEDHGTMESLDFFGGEGQAAA